MNKIKHVTISCALDHIAPFPVHFDLSAQGQVTTSLCANANTYHAPVPDSRKPSGQRRLLVGRSADIFQRHSKISQYGCRWWVARCWTTGDGLTSGHRWWQPIIGPPVAARNRATGDGVTVNCKPCKPQTPTCDFLGNRKPLWIRRPV